MISEPSLSNRFCTDVRTLEEDEDEEEGGNAVVAPVEKPKPEDDFPVLVKNLWRLRKQKKVKPRKTFPKGLLGTSDEFTSSHSASAASGPNRTNSSLPRRSESSGMLFQTYELGHVGNSHRGKFGWFGGLSR